MGDANFPTIFLKCATYYKQNKKLPHSKETFFSKHSVHSNLFSIYVAKNDNLKMFNKNKIKVILDRRFFLQVWTWYNISAKF